MIVGISGLSGSGKDEVGKVLVEQHHFVRVAFADIMKRICMEVFDFTEEQVWGDGKNKPDGRYKLPWSEEEQAKADELNHLRGKKGVDMVKFTAEYPITQYLTPRLALQKLGSWGRECYPGVWAEHTLRLAKELLYPVTELHPACMGYDRVRGLYVQDEFPIIQAEGVVITDVRFKNEIRAVKDAGGKLIRVVRPGHEKPKWNHPSETEQLEVPDSEFDFILWNDEDLNTLKEKTRRMLLGLSYDGCGSI